MYVYIERGPSWVPLGLLGTLGCLLGPLGYMLAAAVLSHARATFTVRVPGPPVDFDMGFPCQKLHFLHLTWDLHVKCVFSIFDMEFPCQISKKRI